jgi:hypothetical protein
MNLHRKILTLILAAVSLASACTGAPAAPTPTRGLSEADIRTQAVGTALAAMTASAPLPTRTATITPQPSNTVTQTAVPTTDTPVPPTLTRVVWPTPTISFTPSQTDFRCEIVEQSPGLDGETTFEPDEDFDLSVRIKNTGDNDWMASSSMRFMYTHGKYIQQSSFPFPITHTDKGDVLHIVVDVRAPDIAGTYVTSYSLIIGKLFFCPVQFRFTVK